MPDHDAFGHGQRFPMEVEIQEGAASGGDQEQQLCRWLLLTLDRLPGKTVTMTQQLIGNMLGVRRAGVMEATARLQKRGVIRYSGGNITVRSRAKLEKRACECYDVVKKEIKRLFAYDLPVQPPAKLTLVSVNP